MELCVTKNREKSEQTIVIPISVQPSPQKSCVLISVILEIPQAGLREIRSAKITDGSLVWVRFDMSLPYKKTFLGNLTIQEIRNNEGVIEVSNTKESMPIVFQDDYTLFAEEVFV